MATGNIGKIKASRVNNVPNVSAYIGEKGILFYNYANGVIRMSDGITPGGVPIPYTVASVDTIGGIKAGPGANVATDGTLTIDTSGLPLSIGNLSFANTTISTQDPNTNLNLVTNGESDINIVGNLHIHPTSQGPDAPNPLFSFTDANVFTANGNVVTNGNLITNGDSIFIGNTSFIGNVTELGNVRMIGNVTVIGPMVNNGASIFNGAIEITGESTISGNTALIGNTLVTGTTTVTGNTYVTGNTFVTGTARLTGDTYVTGNTTVTGSTTVTGNITVTGNSIQTGTAKYIVSSDSMNAGAVEITGNTQGREQPPVVPGVMLHITGQDNGTTPGRVYVDSNRQYSIIVGRRFNGTIESPTQATAGDEVFRLAGTGYPTGGWPAVGLAQIRFIADENQTQTNRGGHLDFLTVPIGSNVMTQAMSISATTGVSIAGNLTANANITVGGNITANGATINGNASISGFMSGKYVRTARNAGVIADGGTLTIDFSTDAIVYCTWANGMSLAYQNYTAGRVVKVMCTKAAGSGTDSISLDGITAAQTSSGSTSITAAADTTTFIELTCVGTGIGNVFAKL